MTAALAGVLGYLALGIVGILGGGRTASLLAILGAWISLALWAPGFAPASVGGEPWGVTVAGDTLALAFWALAPLVHAAVWWHERHRPTTFHGLVTLLVGTCLAAVLSRDLFNLFVLLDLGSLLGTVLIAYDLRSRAVWAGLRYLLLSALGMLVYLLGVGLVYGELGTLSLVRIAELVSGLTSPALAVGASLLVVGAAVKAGVFLIGFWLPEAYRLAPVGVATLLAGLAGKVGIVALARLAEAFPVGPAVAVLGVITGFGGLVYALWERDLMRFLAYHILSQYGYMLVGFGLGGDAFAGAVYYTIAHCLFKGLLFQSSGTGIEAVGGRGIPDLAGRLPRPAVWGLALGVGSIIGLPPLAGFVSKEFLGGLVPAGYGWALTLLGVGTAASFSKLLPLLRPGPGKGPWGGVAILGVGVLAFSAWGLASLPGLLDLVTWGKAAAAVAVGYGLYLVVRRVRVPLPKVQLDHISVAVLAAAGLLAVALLVG
ncbi:MAG: hypothetical protein Kow0097_03800 [Candidatus Bipolaricaulota bacterium]|nr:hypothetical protein [Candidatus Bipolaricaulota bacterium]